jgi:hypothetical protein
MNTRNSHISLGSVSKISWMRIARAAWYPTAALMLVIFIASIPGYILLIPRGFIDDRFTVNPAPEVLLLNLLGAFFSIATVLLSFYLALVLFRRRPEDRMALFLSFYLLAYGVVAVGPLEFLEPMFPGTAIMIATVVFTLIMFPANYFLFVLFPDGQFVPDWTRWMALATIFTSPVVLFTFPALGWDYTDARFFVMGFSNHV